MPIISTFKMCPHVNENDAVTRDWRSCYACIDELTTNLVIARTYLTELAKATFNDNGDCAKPISEPIQGQHFQRIAATALGIIS